MKKILKLANMEEAISKIAGLEGLRLFKSLKNKKNVSEFKLADNLHLEINIVRNLLYKLYHANLVTFTRKKDKEKGWYIYYWTLKAKRLNTLISSLKKERLEIMKERLKKEQNNYFFMCKNSCVRLNFDHAVDINYKCPECGELMQGVDNVEKVAELQKGILMLEKELEIKITKKRIAKPAKAPKKTVKKVKSKKTKLKKKKK